MPARLAPSVEDVPHSRIRELANIAFGMTDVLRLYFGESNEPTPEFIRRAAVRAMDAGFTMYTENAGLPSLREALAGYYLRMHGVALDPQREIVIGASGVEALHVAIRCALDPGEEAIVLTPAWPNGSSNVAMSNARAVEIPHVLAGARYEIDWSALERAANDRTRLLIYTSPSNPLGWVATEEDQRRLLEFARAHNLWLLADEVYERLWYETETPGTPAPSILRQAARDDAVIVVQSFSKNYRMTGWRLGWLVTRADLAQKAAQLNEFVISCAAGFVQKAGETALAEGEADVAAMVARLRENRDFCIASLKGIAGVTLPRPEGAFYIFPRIERMTDSFGLCRRLLLETKVGIAPGVAFGAGGEGSVRICYAADRAVLEPAMERLRKFLEQNYL